MPPPGPPPFRGSDPNRDYQLLASDDAEAAQQAGKQLSASRLFSLARQEVWPLAAGSFALLVGAAAQVGAGALWLAGCMPEQSGPG